jgi:thiamine biosynthesis lipoprotein
MGTDWLFLGAGGFEAAEAEVRRLEAMLTRFRESELTTLNRDGVIDAPPDLARVVELALDGRERTGGRFDPTVHDALVAAGYDRTFSQLEDGPVGDARPCGGDVAVTRGRITLGPGVKVDLGGIAKGYAAERAAEILGCHGACLVDAGGDIALRGSWPVGVGDVTIEVADGGIATSGRDRRHWVRDGREQHHLIDPRTGRPAETALTRVTVVARDAVEAEIQAKNVFLGGPTDACTWVAAS